MKTRRNTTLIRMGSDCDMGKDIKTIVSTLVRKYNSRDPLEIAAHLGIMVQFADLGELKGFYTYRQRKRIIFINENCKNTVSYKLRDMVAAHELGHAVLDSKSQCYFFSDNSFLLKSKAEIEANTFAAELLIDDNAILEYQDCPVSHLARFLGYNEKLVELRMKNSGIISTTEFDTHTA